MPKIIHFRKECIGCNVCAMLAPTFWQMAPEDGKANLVGGVEKNGVWVREAFDDEIDENRESAQNCPVHIIRLVDDHGDEIPTSAASS
jgi:ferredoxin